ncbi:MAG: hypothetical protein PHT07_24400 [Paludibacter sp.]|nr:hypothetical protein [Paludibacter sp.]
MKKAEKDKILAVTKWVRIKAEVEERLVRACRKKNLKHAEFIRDAIIEKLERMGQ